MCPTAPMRRRGRGERTINGSGWRFLTSIKNRLPAIMVLSGQKRSRGQARTDMPIGQMQPHLSGAAQPHRAYAIWTNVMPRLPHRDFSGATERVVNAISTACPVCSSNPSAGLSCDLAPGQERYSCFVPGFNCNVRRNPRSSRPTSKRSRSLLHHAVPQPTQTARKMSLSALQTSSMAAFPRRLRICSTHKELSAIINTARYSNAALPTPMILTNFWPGFFMSREQKCSSGEFSCFHNTKQALL